MFYTIGNVFATINNRLTKRLDPYNPLDLPPNTVRVRTIEYVPDWSQASYEIAKHKDGTPDNIWDVYKSGTSFDDLLKGSSNVIEILGANTIGITSMSNMFSGCFAMTTVPLFDTSKVTDMSHMFDACSSLTAVPLFDTSNVTDMREMFANCYAVETGALALYQQASTQANPPTNHSGTFRLCGRDTQTGAAELAQIPSDWK